MDKTDVQAHVWCFEEGYHAKVTVLSQKPAWSP